MNKAAVASHSCTAVIIFSNSIDEKHRLKEVLVNLEKVNLWKQQ